MDGQAQLSTSPRIRAKRIFKEKKEQKEVGKASTGNRSPIFRCASRWRALPLSYVKNNVVTQDGPPCSGLSADMIGLRPITSHALRDTSVLLLCWFGLPLGASRLAF